MTEEQAGSVQVSDLSHTYNVDGKETKALENVSLKVKNGEFVSIVGPSGCGKSTLLMMLVGLVKPTTGGIFASGQPINGPNPSQVGVVFQEASLYPWLTAQDNVEFPLSLRRVNKKIRRRKAHDALSLVGLAEFADSYPHELSGGMKQRVSIARGLVQNPPIMLMDEPYAALDEQTRFTMGDELLRVWRQTRQTVVFVTHSLNEAVYLSDEVIVLSGRPGRIINRVSIDLPRPRTLEMMSSPRFAELRGIVWEGLKK